MITMGIILLIPIFLFSLVRLSSDFKLQDSLVVGSATYRIYQQDSGSFLSQPFTLVRKELDTNFGVKFVRTIWSDLHYGLAQLRIINISTIEIEIDGDFFRARLDI
jgi:hypothetical protein